MCNKEDQESVEDVDPETMEASEIDEQSKLLEHLLDDENVSESMTTPMDTLQNDVVKSGGNLSSPSKGRGKSPGNSLFIKQTEQTPVTTQRRRGQICGTSSKIPSPNKTPLDTRMTRARTRTASQNSISLSSDADNALESEKVNSKRSGFGTRSRSVKITQLPGSKSPKLFDTPDPKSITQSTLPESVDDMPCRSLVSMETVLMTEPTIVQDDFRKKDLHESLSSSESEAELPDPLKLFEDNRTVAKISTTSTTESIVGVKPLINLFEPDISDDTSKEQNGKTAKQVDQYVAKEQSEFKTSVNPSALFDFDFDSSSDSDLDMIPVPTCKLSMVTKNDDRNILLNTIPSLTTASSDIAEKTISDPKEKPAIRELPSSPVSGTDTTSNASRSIFALEKNFDMDSPTQDSNATCLQEKMSEFPQLEVAVPATISLDEEQNTVHPESADIQASKSNHGTVLSMDVTGKLHDETLVVESNHDQKLLVASEKNVEESAAMIMEISSEKLDDSSSVLTSDATMNEEKSPERIRPENLASATENSDINSVPSSIFALDMDLDVNSSQPDSVLTNPNSTEETKSEYPNAEVILQTASTVSDEEGGTVVQGSVEDSSSHVCGAVLTVEPNQELRNELLAVETNCESELPFANRENQGESPRVKIDSPVKNHEKEIFGQVDESKESGNKSVTRKSLQESASETGESNINNVARSICGLEVNVDVSSSEPSSDVTNSIDEAKSEFSCTEVVQSSAASLDEEPSAVRGIVNAQDSLINAEANQDLPNEVQEMEAERESELLVVNEEILEEHSRMKVGSPSKRSEEPKSPKIIESTESEEKSLTTKSPQAPASETGDSDTNDAPSSIFALDIDLDISSSKPDSDVKKSNEETKSESLNAEATIPAPVPLDEEPTTPGSVNIQGSKSQPVEETKSELPNREVVLVAPSSLDPVHSNFVPESVKVQETNTGQDGTIVSSVGANKELHNEVPSEGTNGESRILPFCSGDNLEESPNARIDIIAVKEKEQITDQMAGLAENEADPITIGSPRSPAPGTDESDANNVHCSIFGLDADLDISSSEPESDATNFLEEKKLNISNREVTHQRPLSLEETPNTDITESVDIQGTGSHHGCNTVSNVEAKKDLPNQLEKADCITEPPAKIGTIFEESPFTKIDIPSERHEEPSSQLICTSTEGVEKPVTKILQQYPASGARESDVNSVRCSVSAFDVVIDISSSEPESDETKLIEGRKSELGNTEVGSQVPLSFDEDHSTVVPEKINIQDSSSPHCGAVSDVGIDQEHRSKLPLVEGNREISEVTEEVFETLITQKAHVLCADESLSKKTTEDEFDNEAQATSNVIDAQKLSAFHAIPARQTTVASNPLNPSSRMLPDQVLPSNLSAMSEQKLEAGGSRQLDNIKPTDIHSPCRFPVADKRDGNPAQKDAHLSPVHRQGSVQESLVSSRINRNVPESAMVPQNPQILKAVRTSAFKVPRVPDTPIKAPDVFPINVTENYPWGRGSTQAVKRTAADDEVAVILKQIRTNIIDMPATVSPLPKSPEPQPAISVKIEEPKSRFPILPRCAFNWTCKKLPLNDQLTERFGAYLHPGVKARVRFRRVSRRLLDIRSPDILSNGFQGVTNFAEAERRPKPIVTLVQFVGDITDLTGYENDATELTEKSLVSVQDQNNLPEKRSSASFSTKEVEEVTFPKSNSTSSTKKRRKVQALVRRPKTTAPALFGSSSSESESESNVVPQPFEEQAVRSSTVRNLNENEPARVPTKESKQTPSLVTTSRAQTMAQLIEPIVPLGRGNRPGFLPIKPNEGQREADSMFNQSRLALGLGRGAKISQHTIAPCSDVLLSATIKSRTVTRVVAPSKHIFKELHVPREPVLTNPILPDSSAAQEESLARKRVSHAFKRGVESDPVVPTVSPSSKRGRILQEGLPKVSSQTAQSKAPSETRCEEVSVSARTRQKSESTLAIKPQDMVKLGVKTPTSSGSEKSQQEIIQLKNFRRIKETVIEKANSETDTDSENGLPMEVNSGRTSQASWPEREMTVTIPSIAEKSILTESARTDHQLLENSGMTIVDESPRSPDEEERPLPPDAKERSPDVEESPRSPDVEESPRSPDVEVSQKTRGVEESSKSREDQPLQSFDKTGRLGSTVEIPLVSSTELEEHRPTAFELVFKELLQESPPVNQKASSKVSCFIFINFIIVYNFYYPFAELKKDINLCVNRVFKNPDVTEESWKSLIERAMRVDSKSHPFIFIRYVHFLR